MHDPKTDLPDIDCVIIGVNCSATLGACIQSLLDSNYPRNRLHIIYSDGGSTDNSLETAAAFPGVQTVALTPETPTPGLGRNAGWKAGTSPLVQFLDSDTEVDPDWLRHAVQAMTDTTTAVCGRREEKHPKRTVYNWIASLEWNGGAGQAEAFGGDVLIRREMLKRTGGYDEILVGGEDPELSQRVRRMGGVITALDVPMTRHDIAMTTIRQYWKRAFRSGYGYAAVAFRHLGAVEGFFFTEFRRIMIRGGGSLAIAGLGLLLGLLANPLWLTLLVPAFALLLYPRIFRVRYFMDDKSLSRSRARTYAWHCSLAVVPQFFGIARYVYGTMFNRPLRNRPTGLRTRLTSTTLVLLLLTTLFATGCAQYGLTPEPTIPLQDQQTASTADSINGTSRTSAVDQTPLFGVSSKKILQDFASAGEIEHLSAKVPQGYRLGPGDVINIQVWQRPDISAQGLVVAPDGIISVSRIGFLNVVGRTVHDIREEVATRLAKFYETPEVSITVSQYKNNKAYVLGRVTNPGVVTFAGQGTLLEALALAGGLPYTGKETFLTKCAIVRGREQIIWIDLRELLNNGNMMLNARIQNNDVIFIPESDDEMVYVMGEVASPGAVALKRGLNLLDAIMYSGGALSTAEMEKIYIIRPSGVKGEVTEINLKHMLETADFSHNYVLKNNDVVYVSPTGLKKFNYALEQTFPFLKFIDMSTSNLEQFGVMERLREVLWNQEGFISSSSSSD